MAEKNDTRFFENKLLDCPYIVSVLQQVSCKRLKKGVATCVFIGVIIKSCGLPKKAYKWKKRFESVKMIFDKKTHTPKETSYGYTTVNCRRRKESML